MTLSGHQYATLLTVRDRPCCDSSLFASLLTICLAISGALVLAVLGRFWRPSRSGMPPRVRHALASARPSDASTATLSSISTTTLDSCETQATAQSLTSPGLGPQDPCVICGQGTVSWHEPAQPPLAICSSCRDASQNVSHALESSRTGLAGPEGQDASLLSNFLASPLSNNRAGPRTRFNLGKY